MRCEQICGKPKTELTDNPQWGDERNSQKVRNESEVALKKKKRQARRKTKRSCKEKYNRIFSL